MPSFDRAAFLLSAPSLKQCPPDLGAEVAFVGRSNAGKSSAINALTRNGKLARTSKTPGRTQLLNFFELDSERRLVDLPGIRLRQGIGTNKARVAGKPHPIPRREGQPAGLDLAS